MPIVSILLALATPAATQTATLEADPYQAALSCGAAAGRSPDLKGIERLAVGIHFTLLAGRHSPSPASLVDKYVTEVPAARQRYAELGEGAAELLPQCRERFPAAWVSSPVALPEALFQRKLVCATAVGLFKGVFDTTNGSVEDRAYFARLTKRFRPLVTPADLKANGLSGGQLIGAMGTALDATLDQGNVLGVTRACDAAFPG